MHLRVPFGVLILISTLAYAQPTPPARDITVTKPGQKQALVIGNQAYLKSPLRTPVDDAQLISQAFEQCGFRVDLVVNVDRQGLERAIDKFTAKLSPGDIVALYFTGLGIQISNENYLTPVDFDPKDTVDAKYSSYAVSRLTDKVEAAGAALFILILDASAKDPFLTAETRKTGLAPLSLSGRTFGAMSSAPGTNSVELVDSKIGLFAGFLADGLAVPGLTLDQLFAQVRGKVHEATSGAQVPLVSVGGDSSLVLKATATSPGVQFEQELRSWNAIRDRADEQTLREFLSHHPRGSFADTANSRLQGFITKTSPSTGSAPTATTPSARNANPKLAQMPEREVDPNFEFTEIEWELLSQSNALDRRYEREGMVLNDPEMQTYVERVGRSILPSATPPPNVRWRFVILRDPVPNAFALANGSVYVNVGLLSVLDNESQLASVLAHEITHVTGRHGFRANRDYRKKALTASIAQMAGNYAPGNSGWGASIKLAAIAIPGLMQAAIMGYARELERQADLFALEKLGSTGYDPREMANVFRHLQAKPEVELQTIYYSDHPKLQDRIDYVTQYINDHKVAENGLFAAQEAQYQTRTERGARANVQLAINAGRRRTALKIAQQLVQRNPSSAENVLVLAETYRSLGPWSAEPQERELSSKGKKDLAKMRSKLTPEEEEEKIRSSPEGQAILQENAKRAEELYNKVIAMDASQFAAYRGLGLLFESLGKSEPARTAFQQYLAKKPDALDAERVKQKIAKLDRKP